MIFTIHTAKEIYSTHTVEERNEILKLRVYGFDFEDWGNGYLMIVGQGSRNFVYAQELEEWCAIWGECVIKGSDITIQNWISTPL